jgi:hypothetical protein
MQPVKRGRVYLENSNELPPFSGALAWLDASPICNCTDFAPIALTTRSYNQHVVVENTAPAPFIAAGYTTASMDNRVVWAVQRTAFSLESVLSLKLS